MVWPNRDYETYDPAVEGYGSPEEWRHTFKQRMGYQEAEGVRDLAKTKGRKWQSEYHVIYDMAGIPLPEKNHKLCTTEIKMAYRKAVLNCHPDRCAVHGKTKEQADEEFKEVTAAYVLLTTKKK